jgi:ABC-type phosphate/phosphonate transport system permease subunit
MTTIPKRRHDDYRPATLRNFWISARNAWWKIEDRAHALFDWAQIALLVLVMGALIALPIYILTNLIFG